MPTSPLEPHPLDFHLRILYSALATRKGLVVATSNPSQAIAKFNQAKTLDIALTRLKVVLSKTNPDGEVWIMQPLEES